MPPEIKALIRKGYEVKQLTPYQFRVECVLDLYPRNRRFHNISNNARGEYPNYNFVKLAVLTAFVDKQVKDADDILDAAVASGRLDVTSAGDGKAERRRWLDKNHEPWFTKFAKAGA